MIGTIVAVLSCPLFLENTKVPDIQPALQRTAQLPSTRGPPGAIRDLGRSLGISGDLWESLGSLGQLPSYRYIMLHILQKKQESRQAILTSVICVV